MSDGLEDRTHQFDAPAGGYGVVVMAASAGGLRAYRRVLSALPGGFPVPVVLVQHISPDHRSLLADILCRHTPLRVKQADDGEALCPGTVYTPAPDRHLRLQTGGTLSLARSPRVRFSRPAADVLFESAAEAYGDRVVAVVLTGGGSDGADGVRAVRRRGGFVIAQDEATSDCPGMPYNAVLTRKVDLVLPLGQVAFALRTLAEGDRVAAAGT